MEMVWIVVYIKLNKGLYLIIDDCNAVKNRIQFLCTEPLVQGMNQIGIPTSGVGERNNEAVGETEINALCARILAPLEGIDKIEL